MAILENNTMGPDPNIRTVKSVKGIKKHKIPISIIGIDQTINFLAPYALMLYQFSSDLKAFLILKPYQGFIFTFRFSNGMEIAMNIAPHEIFVMASSKFSWFILICLFLRRPRGSRCRVRLFALAYLIKPGLV